MRRARWLLVMVFVAAGLSGAVVAGARVSRPGGRAAVIATTPAAAVFVAPGEGATLRGRSARVTVSVPRGERLVVKLNGRDVSQRFRGRVRRSAVLGSGAGLLPGVNTLFAMTLRGRRQVGIQARGFVMLRGDRRVAVTRVGAAASGRGVLGATPPMGVMVSVSAGPSRRSGLPGAPRSMGAVLRSARTPCVFRASLNGRDVTRYFDSPQRSSWTASLSPSQGLRFGANLLRTTVIEPGTGRYVSVTRVVRVPRSRPLAAAGVDRVVPAGARLRLDGGRSLATGRGMRLRFRWRLVERPAGSRAVLRGVAGRRPLIVPDRPGTYSVQLIVAQTRAGGSRRSGQRAVDAVTSSPDAVTVTAQPPTPFIDGVNVEANQGGRSGIQIGSAFYPNPSPGPCHCDIQVLTLDRHTLEPTGLGNAYTDGSDQTQIGVAELMSQILSEGTNRLVIIAQPYTARIPIAAGPTQAATVKTFNQILGLLGAAGLPTSNLTQGYGPFSVIGVPYSDVGSGWLKTDTLLGSFMLSGGYYAFTPTYYRFDTSARAGFDTNGMSFPDLPGGAQSPLAGLGGDIHSGFQVVVFNGHNLALLSDTAWGVNGPFFPGDKQSTASELGAMHQVLKQAIGAGDLVFVQSIGNVDPSSATLTTPLAGAAWNLVAQDMVALGANLGMFNQINGSYAFVGGAGLPPSEVAEVSSAVPGQPNPAHLQGYFAVDRQGRYHAVLPDATGQANLGLYSVLHQAPTPWPYTTGPDADHYAAAMQYLTNQRGFSAYPSIRAAYYADDNYAWATEPALVQAVPYPGGNPGFTATQLKTLKNELANVEIPDVAQATQLFNNYQAPFLRATGSNQADLSSLEAEIQADIKPSGNTSVALSFVSAIVNGAMLVAAPYAELPIQAAIGALTAATSLAAPIADLAGGSPAPDEVTAKANQLSAIVGSSYAANATAMDALRDVAVSDYGKLKAIAAAAKDPQWAGSSTAIAEATAALQLGARQSFYGALISTAFPTVEYWNTLNADPKYGPGECDINYDNLPRTAWTRIVGALPGNEWSQSKPAYQIWSFYVYTHFFSSNTQLPATVTDPLTTPIYQHTIEPDQADDRPGLGLYLPTFMSQNFELERGPGAQPC
jgi:hypothetical protein